MSIYSSVLRKTAIPYLLRRDSRASAISHWRDLERSQFRDSRRLLDLQWERLHALLRHAYKTVPYYQRVFNERGLTPESFRDFSDLARLPVLTREMIRANTDSLFSSRFEKSQLVKFGTGGTTRRAISFYRDQESHNRKVGAAWRFEGFMGRRPGDKLCLAWPVHVDLNPHDRLRTRVKNRYLSRELMFYMGAATEEQLDRYYRMMCSFRPRYLKGFPNALDLFAEFIRSRGYRPPPVRAIQTTGETLLPHHRERFHDVFGGPVFDMYGSREVGNTACECDQHQGMHVAMETSFVEILTDGRPAPPGVEGEMIVTDLTNYGFPLIRYAIEDHGAWTGTSCSCGRGLALISHGVGRLCDQYVAPDGSRHSALALSAGIADNGPPVGQIQFIQKSLSHFHLLITDDPPMTEQIERYIRDVMAKLLSPSVRVTMELVKDLPREVSGKVRYCICEIDSSLRR